MEKLDSEAILSVRDAVSDVRETLFAIAIDVTRLHVRPPTDLHALIQGANYKLGETERELLALTRAP